MTTTKITPHEWADRQWLSYPYVQFLISRGCIEVVDGLIDADVADQVLLGLSVPQIDEKTLAIALNEATAQQMLSLNKFISRMTYYLGLFNAHERHYFETVVDPGLTIILDILKEWLNRTTPPHEEQDHFDRTNPVNNNAKGK